jgi:hypothetical protein
VDIGLEGIVEPGLGGGSGEVTDESVGSGEPSLEAVLDGSVGDGHGQVGLASSGRPAQDHGTGFADELGAEEASEHLEAHGGLEGEVELLDGAQEGELGLPHGSGDAGLGPWAISSAKRISRKLR